MSRPESDGSMFTRREFFQCSFVAGEAAFGLSVKPDSKWNVEVKNLYARGPFNTLALIAARRFNTKVPLPILTGHFIALASRLLP